MENIVPTLIEQHRVLQDDILSVLDFVHNNFDSEKIVFGLGKFRSDLNAHIELEKGFYEDLLKKMENIEQDTTNTKIFIEEMVQIGKKVFGFLDKYSIASSVNENKDLFKSEILEIKETLWLRIESEELGVYTSYTALG